MPRTWRARRRRSPPTRGRDKALSPFDLNELWAQESLRACGDGPGKRCVIGPACFPAPHRGVAARAVSLYEAPAWLPKGRAGLPLRAHCNPRSASTTSSNILGVFLSDAVRCLALFAVGGFWSTFSHLPHGPLGPLVDDRPPPPLKAGYAAPSAYPNAGLPPSHNRPTRPGHRLGPPRSKGLYPHAFAGCPRSLTPSPNARLGVERQRQELHRCALGGFLAPPL